MGGLCRILPPEACIHLYPVCQNLGAGNQGLRNALPLGFAIVVVANLQFVVVCMAPITGIISFVDGKKLGTEISRVPLIYRFDQKEGRTNLP